jgi:hypothetical protein
MLWKSMTRISRRRFLQLNIAAKALAMTTKSTFKVAVITDEIKQDFNCRYRFSYVLNRDQ